MDGDLYDEFGNYVGPDIESEEESDQDLDDNDNEIEEFNDRDNEVIVIQLIAIQFIYFSPFLYLGSIDD